MSFSRYHIYLALILALCISTAAYPQVPEGIANDEETDTEVSEELLQRYEDPIDLNTCTKEDIDALPMLSTFQKSSLWEYLGRQRPMQSMYELQYILGFGLADAQLLASIATLSQPDNRPKSSRIKQELYYATGISRAAGDAITSLENPFADTKQLMKYRLEHPVASAGITAENDAGESFRVDPAQLGTDYLSAYATCQVGNTSVLAGDYDLRWGQGLAVWQGFSMGRGAPADISRVSKSAFPHRSTEENRFMRGAAVTHRWGIAQLTLAASAHLRDGAITGDSTFTQTYTGLHRTAGETARRDQLSLSTLAARFHTETTHLHTSLQVLSHTWESANGQELRSATGRTQLASADFKAGGDGLLAFGEIAADAQLRTAFIAGIQANPAPGAELCIAARNYSPGYTAIDASGSGEYSGTENERGVYAGASLYPWERLKMSGYFDLFASPEPRYRQSYPASGHEYMVSAQYSLSQAALLTLRHSQQTKPLDLPATDTASATRQMPDSRKASYSARLSLTAGTVPISAGIYQSEYRHSAAHETGHLIYLQVQPAIGRYLRIAYQIAVFSTSYNTRIYVYEPHLPQSMSVPAHIGTGVKNAVRADIRLPHIHISLKYAYLLSSSDYQEEPVKTSKHELWASCIVKIRSR